MAIILILRGLIQNICLTCYGIDKKIKFSDASHANKMKFSAQHNNYYEKKGIMRRTLCGPGASGALVEIL